MPHAHSSPQELDDWGTLGVRGTSRRAVRGFRITKICGAGLAELTGATPQEVVAMNSLTVNLHLMLAAFYRPRGKRSKILIEAGAFPSDRHAVASQLEWHGLDPPARLIELAPGRDRGCSCRKRKSRAPSQQLGAEIALVLWPGVQYRTGQLFDLRASRAPRTARAACRL